MISEGGSVADYRGTLGALAPVVGRAETVVPGHGPPAGREAVMRLLEEDLEYLDALERRERRPVLPPGRDSSRQRAVHAENLGRVGEG